ncbi:14717_t:CDS:2, partial [Gigaspora margarita]
MPHGGKKGTLYLISTCPVDTSLTLIQSAFTYQEIYNQAIAFALSDSSSHTNLLLQVFDRIKQKKWDRSSKFIWGLLEWFFSQFFWDSLNRNLLVVKSIIMDMCNLDYCPKKASRSTNCYEIILVKSQVPLIPGNSYLETYLKSWQEPYIVPCSAEFKTMNEEKPIDIPLNAFKIDKYQLRLPLILVINVAGINVTDERAYLENKDLPKEIDFPLENVNIKQRYRLTGVSFCDGSHHIADVCFENVRNT